MCCGDILSILTRRKVTVLAIRAVQAQMHIGMRESEVMRLVDEALAVAGLTERWALVLFGGASYVSPRCPGLTVGPKKMLHSLMAQGLIGC